MLLFKGVWTTAPISIGMDVARSLSISCQCYVALKVGNDILALNLKAVRIVLTFYVSSTP